jgi:hypothetical protein
MRQQTLATQASFEKYGRKSRRGKRPAIPTGGVVGLGVTLGHGF